MRQERTRFPTLRKGGVRPAAGAGDLVLALTSLALIVWLAHFLYRRQIFLRV